MLSRLKLLLMTLNFLTLISLLDQEKYIKPWMDYVHSSLDKSLLVCLDYKEKFSEMWRCSFHLSPIYKQHKMKERCPAYHKFVDEDSLPDKFSESGISQARYIKQLVKYIIGQIIISVEACPLFGYFWLKNSNEDYYTMIVQYIFKTDAALRVNVTFLQFELTQLEEVQIRNGGLCPHFFDVKVQYYECFEVMLFLL